MIRLAVIEANQQSKKYKILALCDHALSTSGVGVQSRYLFNGLINTGKYTIRSLGGAVKHSDYSVIKVSDDLIIKPVDGFGDQNMLRQLLITERPDVLFLFTDPRFFIWVWEMEEEIHQICPIAYNTIWDARPAPHYNAVLYQSTDLLNCISDLTHAMISEIVPEHKRVNFIPHALPRDVFKPIKQETIKELRSKMLAPDRVDHFICLWISRNAKRKRPSDVLVVWKMFLEKLNEKHGHRNATLIMHTDPLDSQGANLLVTTEMLGIVDRVFYSKDRLDFDQMAALHNISDVCMNISSAEGFGLSTLEAMQCGKPIIAAKTGGLTRQVVDHRDGSENGIALDIEMKTMVGSLLVPFINEDYCSNEAACDALLKMYELGGEKRQELGQKARDYVLSEFNIDKTIASWDETLTELIETWRASKSDVYRPWEIRSL